MNYRATSKIVPTAGVCKFLGTPTALLLAMVVLCHGAPTRAEDLSEQADLIAPRVFLIGHPKAGTGTGFLISKEHRLLATNAHVADMIHETGSLYAMQNNSSHVFKIDKVWFHPGVLRETEAGAHVQSQDPGDGEVHPVCPDVAVCHVAGDDELPDAVQLASWDGITSAVAEPIGMLGFPAHDTTDWPGLGEEAKATYRQGVVARVSDFKHNAGTDEADLQFVQHTMTSWFGFSGSPIFLENGHVVAVNNSSRKQEEQGMSTQIMYGIRIDCLWELLAYHKLTDKLSVPIAVADLRLDRFKAPAAPVSAGGTGESGRTRPSGPPLAIAPFDADKAKEFQVAWAKHLGVPVVKTNSIGMKLVLIPPGSFMMGEKGSQHPKEIREPFYVGVCEVAVEQFRMFVNDTEYMTVPEKIGSAGGSWKKPWVHHRARRDFVPIDQSNEHPVMGAGWSDAVAFCVWLSRKEGEDYYLPQESQWEYACRSGTLTTWYHGDDRRRLARIGNVMDFSYAQEMGSSYEIPADDGYAYTSPIGSFRPNAFGLYDMHGNVAEWCQEQTKRGYHRLRGGDFEDHPYGTSSGLRVSAPDSNGHGFRVVCEP